ncbi:hypothetical protein AOLI_G00227730 [Acnodon oligacanthus]
MTSDVINVSWLFPVSWHVSVVGVCWGAAGADRGGEGGVLKEEEQQGNLHSLQLQLQFTATAAPAALQSCLQ